MFTSHREIKDTSLCPFGENCAYLYIESDNGFYKEAYELAEDSTLNIETLLNRAMPDCTVEISKDVVTGSPNYAAIITDGRSPDSCIVWDSCDFYLTCEY